MNRYKFLLVSLVAFLVIGNALRLIPIPRIFLSAGSLNTTEILFYLISIMIVVLTPKYFFRFPLEFLGIYACFMLSFLMAVIRYQEIPFFPLSHNLRILFYFLSTYGVGLALFKIFKEDLTKILNFVLAVFAFNVLVAWALYLIFPTAAQIWELLYSYGITFKGDYGLNRLLGTIFDPNFFGNLLIFPIIVSLFLMEKTEKRIYFWLFLFFLFSIFFTISRSSLLGLSIGLAIYHMIGLRTLIKGFKIKKVLVFNILIFIAALIGVILLAPDQLARFYERFAGISNDLSARHRYEDMVLAFDLMTDVETLFLGIGFNFFKHLKLTWLSTVDSSIMTLIVTLGIPLFTLIIIFFTRLFKFIRPTDSFHLAFYKQVFLVYLITSLVICNFNNLLFYTYWIVWVFPFISYFYLIKKEKQGYAVGH
jgi:hypothetical protein